MPRSGQKSFAFGAGGAQMWMEEKLGTCNHTNRTEEAFTKGASRIAVGCHFCHIMLSDGLTQTRSETSAHEGRGRRRGLYTSRSGASRRRTRFSAATLRPSAADPKQSRLMLDGGSPV